MAAETLVVNVGPAGAEKYTFTKQPGDKLKYTFDYTEWLEDSPGVTISSYVLTILPSDGTLGAPTNAAATNTGTKVYVTLNGGSKNYAGKITCKATMSDTRIKEAEFYLYIQEF
jgi:hypothetical protein